MRQSLGNQDEPRRGSGVWAVLCFFFLLIQDILLRLCMFMGMVWQRRENFTMQGR